MARIAVFLLNMAGDALFRPNLCVRATQCVLLQLFVFQGLAAGFANHTAVATRLFVVSQELPRRLLRAAIDRALYHYVIA
eukprot:3248633-Pyramimonas_sp.AAC.1